jgi:hypothetical protein
MNILVRRDQFNITPQGIVHKPTDAAFTPYPGNPYSGITRMGQLGNKHPNGSGFRSDDVQRMMRELWVEYVTGNPKLFKTDEPGALMREQQRSFRQRQNIFNHQVSEQVGGGADNQQPHRKSDP